MLTFCQQTDSIHDFTVRTTQVKLLQVRHSKQYCSNVRNMYLIVFALICCIIFVLLLL